MRSSVLLPEPFGPSKPTISPRPIAKDTPPTAGRGPYDFAMRSATMTGDADEDMSVAAVAGVRSRKRPIRPIIRRAVPLFVEFRRVLVRLEGVGIVRVDHV